jgi:hypothetical protein
MSKANITADTSRVDLVRHALTTWGKNDPVVQVAAVRPIMLENQHQSFLFAVSGTP